MFAGLMSQWTMPCVCVASLQLPDIRAAIALKGDQQEKAVELLASASPYERAYPETEYLRGLAYLRLKKRYGCSD